jgi:hypothetical protein
MGVRKAPSGDITMAAMSYLLAQRHLEKRE